ncbi:MAG: hypothetical protein K1X42_08535 [Opitutaceae bacterium]|nr:hypothetical protein [Opitutaceae bacterium]
MSGLDAMATEKIPRPAEWPAPRAIYFRQQENFASLPPARALPYEAPAGIGHNWRDTFSQLNGNLAKVLEDLTLGRVTIENYMTRLAQDRPKQLNIAQFDMMARLTASPLFKEGGYHAWHWLYYAGTRTTAAIAAGDSHLKVRSTEAFTLTAGRIGGVQIPDDAVLCRWDEANNRPDYSHSEQVRLVAIDAANGILTIQRGLYGTAAQEFPEGAYIAPHVSRYYTMDGASWVYNYSDRAPVLDGVRAGDIYARELEGWYRRPTGRLAAMHGIDFDSSWLALYGGNPRRGYDANADGIIDQGYFGPSGEQSAKPSQAWANSWDRGITQFFQQVRRRMDAIDPDILIIGDGHFIDRGTQVSKLQRAAGIMDGLEMEGFADIFDYRVIGWSNGLNRVLYWRDHGRRDAKHAFNLVVHKFTRLDASIGGREGKRYDAPHNIDRLVMAAAVVSDAVVGFLDPPKNPRTGETMPWEIYDELILGAEGPRKGWLGKPKGDLQRLALRTPSLLPEWLENPQHADGEVVGLFSTGGVLCEYDPEKEALKCWPTNPDVGEFSIVFHGLAIPPREEGDDTTQDLVVRLSALAAPDKNLLPTQPREMRVTYPNRQGAEAKLPDTLRHGLAWIDTRDWTETVHYFNNLGPATVDLKLTFEGNQPVWIKQWTAHAATDLICREFEHGLVLVNPGDRNETFDLSGIKDASGKTRQFRRFKGSELQDPITNNGRAVGEKVVVPADKSQGGNALFLIER